MFLLSSSAFLFIISVLLEGGGGGSFKRLKTPQKLCTHILNFRQ